MNTNKAFAKTIIGALLALVAMAAPVAAFQTVDFTNAAFAAVSGPTSIPVGHAEFCKKYRAECVPNANPIDAEPLTDARWQDLLEVNADMNASIVPVTDEDLYQVVEYWTYPRGFGDCEDIALAKRRELAARGWDISTLLMTVVREANGDGHAVLMVRTDRGDLVLDNKVGEIKVWTDTPYHFIKRQSQSDAGMWVGIEDERPVIVAAN